MVGFLNVWLNCMAVPWKGNENEVVPHLSAGVFHLLSSSDDDLNDGGKPSTIWNCWSCSGKGRGTKGFCFLFHLCDVLGF